MNPTPRTSFTFELDAEQQARLRRELERGNYRLVEVPHAIVAAERPDCHIVLYESGKCVAQGMGAADWVTFVLEPIVLRRAALGYEDELDPSRTSPHIGVDESGKGDYFGPLVVAAAYVDEALVPALEQLHVRDSKRITSDAVALRMAREIRRALGERHVEVVIGPEAYNRLHARLGNVNAVLAWGHARAIENLLERVPDCPRALSDQFGPAFRVKGALMRRGRSIRLEQRPRAESDPAVAAASVLARARFLEALADLGRRHDVPLPKGASPAAETTALELVRREGPQVLWSVAKCHFQTTDRVLAAAGLSRKDLGAPPEPRTAEPPPRPPRRTSRTRTRRRRVRAS
ncbi:MAG: ribonuclease HIII [Kiritimatiellae bacterium]|nr:ribonuclease HIII [Kiritimatiellia bacterium]